MLVDSSGSRNPEASPSATQLPIPELAATPGHEADHARLGQRRCVLGIAEQVPQRFLVADVLARVNVPGADTVLQRNAPVPSRRARGRHRVWRARSLVRHLHGHRAIVRQIVAPILVAGLQRAFDEHAAKTGAIDVQIGLQAVSLLEDDLIDETIGALRDAHDRAFQAHDTGLLGVGAEVSRHEAGVEMQCVLERRSNALRVAWKDELVRLGHRNLETEMTEIDVQRLRARLVPEVIERQPIDEHAEGAEGVPEAMADVEPVDEADRKLDGRLRMPHEIRQVDPDEPEKVDDARDRRFAHADGRDVRRLDQLDRAACVPLCCASALAAIQPAVPPPTMAMRLMRRSVCMEFSSARSAQRGTGRSVEAKGGDRRRPTAPCHMPEFSEAAADAEEYASRPRIECERQVLELQVLTLILFGQVDRFERHTELFGDLVGDLCVELAIVAIPDAERAGNAVIRAEGCDRIRRNRSCCRTTCRASRRTTRASKP